MRYLAVASLLIGLLPSGAGAQGTISAKPPAAPDPVSGEFAAVVTSVAQSLRNATMASFCQFRSERWFNTMQQGLVGYMEGEEARLAATAPSRGAFMSYASSARVWVAKYSQPPVPNREQCQAFFRGPELAHLDGIERAITGNYH